MTVNLKLQSETLASGSVISAGSFIASAIDIGNRPIQDYAFYDAGGGGGHFTLNGVTEATGQWIYVTPSQLSQLQYVAGSAGADTIYVAAWDGRWSVASTSASVAALPPSVTAANQTLTEGQSIAASSLIGSVKDPAGKAITQYALSDSGTDGHLVYNGTVLAANHWYNFTADQLSHVTFVGGSSVGTDKVSIEVSDGGAFSAASTATISVQAPTSPLAKLLDPGIHTDVAALMTGNSLSYSAMLTVLQDAAATAMTAAKFGTLQTLESLLNAPNGIAASSYVQQITNDVINGNAANAYWNGGADNPVNLGNLTTHSTTTQMSELVGKWFLGTDLPSLAGTGVAGSYHTSSLPLFGASGAPSNLDVNQGNVGDCYLMASLGEAALRNPSAIQSMISSNGNGTDAVRFFVNGVADYVTVNTQLPAMSGGYQWANGSTLEFANGSVNWVALIEKAYVELNEQMDASQGTVGSAYENISGGYASTLTQITNQPVTTYGLYNSMAGATLGTILSTLEAGWKAGDLMTMSTPTASNGNLVGDHMYEVTAVNPITGVISLQNPWNASYSGPLQMAFTETIQQLAADNCTLYDSPNVAVPLGVGLLH